MYNKPIAASIACLALAAPAVASAGTYEASHSVKQCRQSENADPTTTCHPTPGRAGTVASQTATENYLTAAVYDPQSLLIGVSGDIPLSIVWNVSCQGASGNIKYAKGQYLITAGGSAPPFKVPLPTTNIYECSFAVAAVDGNSTPVLLQLYAVPRPI